MNETIVIYHGGCRDGFCAAWVVNKYFNKRNLERDIHAAQSPINLIYHPGYYGQEPPDIKNKNVIIVDFCYPLEIMKLIMEECRFLIWLDHHKTAQPFADYLSGYDQSERLKFIFDTNRSGAGLAWDYFFPNKSRPWLVNYVEDRDLWRKELPLSDTANAYISALKFDFGVWDKVSTNIEPPFEYGSVIEMKTEQYVNEVCKNMYFVNLRLIDNPITDLDVVCEWENIPVVNICQVDCSEVLHELCKRYRNSPFSLYWFKRADGLYQYGLRSIGRFDVSIVAKLFGGGGHKNAAGFQLPYLLEELK